MGRPPKPLLLLGVSPHVVVPCHRRHRRVLARVLEEDLSQEEAERSFKDQFRVGIISAPAFRQVCMIVFGWVTVMCISHWIQEGVHQVMIYPFTDQVCIVCFIQGD